MTKAEYMLELQKSLKSFSIRDIDDILDEYEQHFKLKMADGYSEEEIAARLELPKDIAAQFGAIAKPNGGAKKSGKAFLACSLGLFSVFVAMSFLLLFCAAAALAVLSIGASALGVCLITTINPYGIIPSMPYLGSLLMGLSCLGLGVFSAAGTVYAWLYSKHFVKMYMRWFKKTLHGQAYPPASLHPAIDAKFRRGLRNTAMISLVAFGVAAMAALLTLFAYTGFKPFWHELGWFQ